LASENTNAAAKHILFAPFLATRIIRVSLVYEAAVGRVFAMTIPAA
jgi:hypothetical protein